MDRGKGGTGWRWLLALLQKLALASGTHFGELTLGFRGLFLSALRRAGPTWLVATFGPFAGSLFLSLLGDLLAPFALLEASRALLIASLLALVLGIRCRPRL